MPGKVALYMEDASAGADFGTVQEDTIGLRMSDADGRSSFYYIPGCAALPPDLGERLQGSPLVQHHRRASEHEDFEGLGGGIHHD